MLRFKKAVICKYEIVETDDAGRYGFSKILDDDLTDGKKDDNFDKLQALPKCNKEKKSESDTPTCAFSSLSAKYIIEARSDLQIFYHGTSSKFLKKILKHGLLPETKEGVWKEEDPTATPQSPSRKSYGGVYWSNQVNTSLQYADDTARKFGGNPLIVMALLQVKTALPDEDDFHSIVTRSLDTVWGKNYRITNSDKALLNVLVTLFFNEKSEGDNIVQSFIDNFLEELGGSSPDSLAPKVVTSEFKKALHDLLLADIIRRLSHIHWEGDYLRDLKDVLVAKPIPDALKKKTAAEGERGYRDALSVVLKHARNYVKHTYWNKTLRIVNPIGFSGRNRITGIVEKIQKGSSCILKKHYGQIANEWLDGFKSGSSGLKIVEASLRPNR